MLPEIGGLELLVIAAVALIVVGPKDLPIMLRKLGQFTAKVRGMANEFRASFDEMARQSELDELRKEVEAMRRGSLAESAAMDASKTLIWNGPLGVFEVPPFDAATVAAARHAAELTKAGKLIAVAGGGDTVAALNHAGTADDMTFVSTAGGAFLEWMEGKVLPGVEALRA